MTEAAAPLVPAGFAVPAGLTQPSFVLEPLGPEHNEADYAAWTSSMDHIRSSPGYEGRNDWPDPALTPEDNARDLAGHAADFAARTGFTYTVLDAESREVIGCVYLYPPKSADVDVDVRSWVRADRAELDRPLRRAVAAWLAAEWPFRAPAYAGTGG